MSWLVAGGGGGLTDVWSPSGLATVGVSPERDWTAKPFRALSHWAKVEAKAKIFFCRLFFEYFPCCLILFVSHFFLVGIGPSDVFTLSEREHKCENKSWCWQLIDLDFSESHKRFSFFCHSVYASLYSDLCLRAASVFTPETNGNGKKRESIDFK